MADRNPHTLLIKTKWEVDYALDDVEQANVGTALYGQRFDQLIVSQRAYMDLLEESDKGEHLRTWFYESVLCRFGSINKLPPGAQRVKDNIPIPPALDAKWKAKAKAAKKPAAKRQPKRVTQADADIMEAGD